MARKSDLPVVLLPIRPQYAQPIIDGRKKVEFRKTVFRSEPGYVVVYASSPVQRVLGYFEVSGVDVAAVSTLWERYSQVGCIKREAFAAYYGSRATGLALRIGEVVALSQPVELSELGINSRPPQSFTYLPQEVIDAIDRRGGLAGTVGLGASVEPRQPFNFNSLAFA